MPTTRTPPADIRRMLREEVGFGCPICRKPFLEYHHFDPPWHEAKTHNPDGMIALCVECHRQAGAGAYSKAHLRDLKGQEYSLDSVKARFPWANSDIVYRVGGNYVGNEGLVLTIEDENLIELKRGPGGLLLLSMDVRAADDKVIARIRDNDFEAQPDDLHDLEVNTGSTRVKIWFGKRKLGLDLSFKRITMSDLQARLEADNPDANMLRCMQEHGDLPEDSRRAFLEHFQDDPVRDVVLQWAREHFPAEDPEIPFLDFKRLETHKCGYHVSVRHGVRINGPSIVDGRCEYNVVLGGGGLLKLD
ncbi:MAG: HNH endonuclease [Phycisphaerales bacterium]|nr:MAG: HNH endonuclease [Phycisphaerales bacterium]